MSEKAKIFIHFITSLSGSLNVYRKSDLEINTCEEINTIIGEGLTPTNKAMDKINLSKDFSKVKKDISNTWDSREEFAY